MYFKPSEFPGGYERQCLRRINRAELFPELTADPAALLLEAVRKDRAFETVFSSQFEAILTRAAALKPTEETEVVLAVKAELNRLYTVSCSLCGEQSMVQQGLQRLIDLTMQSVKRAAVDDAVAMKELQQEQEARTLHCKLLKCDLVADLLNSHSGVGSGQGIASFIPPEELLPTLLSADKAVLAEVVQLFDRQQVSEITEQAAALLENLKIPEAIENLEFIKGYGVYLETHRQ